MVFNVAQRTLTDTRDNKTYTVRKLADGKCWMTQNLWLVGPRTLTSTNSDISSGSFALPVSTGGIWASSVTDSSAANTARVYEPEYSVDPGQGAYYNWYTATAGSGLYSNTTTNAANSICSKGWRLPSTGDYNNMWKFSNNNINIFFANYRWNYSGLWSATMGDLHHLNTVGTWWSNQPTGDATKAFYLSVESTGPGVLSDHYKVDGFSVRCVAR